jgi:hypothetical protein
MILRLYVLVPLEEDLLELLVLNFRSFRARDCDVGLGAEGSEFLFQE